MDRQPNARDRAREATRARVLAAARCLFDTVGDEAATIRAIAEAAGMSTGAVFAHWDDKAQLYRSAYGHPPITPEQGRAMLAALDALRGVRPCNWNDADDPQTVAAWTLAAGAEGDVDREQCMACLVTVKDGDPVHNEIDGGVIHADCCGPERESYFKDGGEPLGPDDPIPAPFAYRAVFPKAA